MSTLPERHLCDLSGRSFPSRFHVRGGLSLDTGDALRVWGDVSPAAAREILEFITKRFPKNTPIVREAHAKPLSSEPVKQCDLCDGTREIVTPAIQSGGEIIEETSRPCLCTKTN